MNGPSLYSLCLTSHFFLSFFLSPQSYCFAPSSFACFFLFFLSRWQRSVAAFVYDTNVPQPRARNSAQISVRAVGTVYTKLKTQLKRTTKRDLRRRKTPAWNGKTNKHGRSIVLEKEMSRSLIWSSTEWVSVGEEREGHSECVDAPRRQRKRGNRGWKFGMRNLEAEGIKSRAESAGGCVRQSER